MPAAMWTTVPPAKSSAPIFPRSPIALAPRLAATTLESNQSNAHTMWASGQYTKVTHSTMNRQKGQKRMRSAMAPEIRAGVMIANIPWNMTWT